MKKKLAIVIFFFLAIPILLFLGGVWGVYSNQKKITHRAVNILNENFNGELTIEDSYISPFANFPYISIDIHNVSFYDNKLKEGKALYQIEDAYIGFDIWSIISGKYAVKSIKIDGGYIDIVQHEDGSLNILNAKVLNKEKEQTSESTPLEFNLNNLELKNFKISHYIEIDCKETLIDIEAANAKINIANEIYTINLESNLILNLLKDGKPIFFADKKIELDIELNYNDETKLIAIVPSSLKLEDALFQIKGSVDIDDDFDLDLSIDGQKPDFNIFAAFAPNEIAEVLKRYKNKGKVYFNGKVKGKSINGHKPALSVEFGCENAYFVNTTFNKKVDEISFAGFYSNGEERTLKSSELRLQQFTAKPEQGIFQGTLIIRDFEDPYINVNLHADLDLEFVGQFLQLEGLQRIKGQILLDMDFNELIDLSMPGESLAQLKEGLDSELTIKNLSFIIPQYPLPIKKMNGHAIMRNGEVTMDKFEFLIGESDFSFTGFLSDFPALFHQFKQPIKINLIAHSKKINLPELLSFDSLLMSKSNEQIENFQTSISLETEAYELMNFNYLPKGKFFIDDFYAKFKNYPHVLHDFHADIIIEEENLKLKDFSGEIDKSDFHFTGIVNNYTKWFHEVKKGKSTFDFNLHSNELYINDLLTYNGENYLPEDYKNEYFKSLNANGKLILDYDSVLLFSDLILENLTAKMQLHPLILQNFKGRIHIENENYLLENFSGKIGNSDIHINLALSNKENPLYKDFFHLKSKALDLDELMNYDAKAPTKGKHEKAFNIFELPFRNMEFSAEIGKMNYHTYWLDNLQLKGSMKENHFFYIDTFSLYTADGSLGMSGYFNGSNPENIYFSSTMYANQLDIDKLMIKFENFGQDYFINENIHGKINGTIKSNFLVHPDFTPILEKSEAQLDLMILNGSLAKFAPLQELSKLFKDKNLNLVRFDTLQNSIHLKEGVLSIPKMNINTSLGFLEFSGKQSLDLSMDYFVRIPLGLVTKIGFRSLFGKERDDINPEQEDEIIKRDPTKKVMFVNVNMKGTPDDMKISLGKDKEDQKK